MKKLLFVLGLLGLSVAVSLGAPEPVREARKGIVAVMWKDGDEWRFACSGFAVGVRLVYTAAHCVDFTGQYAVQTEQGVMYGVRVLARRYDRQFDQALLQLQTEDYLRPLYRCKAWPGVGDSLWVWGSPRGLRPVLRSGIYSGPLRYWANPVLEKAVGEAHFSDINVDGGASGSPVLTNDGCYVGIVSMIFRSDLKLDGAIFKKVF